MIEFKNVSKLYKDGTRALSNVDFKIEDGEFVFVVGASGAGKSTLIRLLMHEETVTGGQIFVDGEDISKIKNGRIPYLRRKLGVVYQDFRLLPNKNVYDNVAFAMRVIGAPAKDVRRRVPAILDLVGLVEKAHSFPSTLSGGEMQRVALARALVNKPKYIIADEPTGNIDPEMSTEIMALLSGISARGNITVLVVTHEKTLVDTFNKRVVTIQGGSLISDRTGGYSK